MALNKSSLKKIYDQMENFLQCEEKFTEVKPNELNSSITAVMTDGKECTFWFVPGDDESSWAILETSNDGCQRYYGMEDVRYCLETKYKWKK